MPFNNDAEEEAFVQGLMGSDLFESYWEISKTEGPDLVLLLDLEQGKRDIAVLPRRVIMEDPSAPDFLKERLDHPASQDTSKIMPGGHAFWLMTSTPDGYPFIAAVSAHTFNKGGSA